MYPVNIICFTAGKRDSMESNLSESNDQDLEPVDLLSTDTVRNSSKPVAINLNDLLAEYNDRKPKVTIEIEEKVYSGVFMYYELPRQYVYSFQTIFIC